jgi:hypothetical protein
MTAHTSLAAEGGPDDEPLCHGLDAMPTDNRASSTRLDRRPMPPLKNPKVADLAPSGRDLTVYDEEHGITYLRILDANAEGADWREFAQIVLRIDPEREPDRARRAYDSHLARQMGVERRLSAIAAERMAIRASGELTTISICHPAGP